MPDSGAILSPIPVASCSPGSIVFDALERTSLAFASCSIAHIRVCNFHQGAWRSRFSVTGLAAYGDAAPPMVCQRPVALCSNR